MRNRVGRLGNPSFRHRLAPDAVVAAELAKAAATPNRIPSFQHRVDLDAAATADLTGRLQARGQVSETSWVGAYSAHF